MEKMTLTVKEAAQMLNVSVPTMYDLTHRADFPVIIVGQRRRVIPIDQFKEWIAKESRKGNA